ncbi:MAG: bifunctional precorrin-2 dehydrogenase/sirohydrochlorin ferrochelatase [Thermodesulfobacteriota bacterium]
MKAYPLMMLIHDKPVLVVGGGRVALRKVRSLLECGAEVTVISPEVEDELQQLVAQGHVRWIAEPFREELVLGNPEPALVFGTTDQREVNVRINRLAAERGIPCNIADVPELCTFTVPAVVSRGDLTIAVSTSGASPALARRIRERLEGEFGAEYEVLTRMLAGVRQAVIPLGYSSDRNRELFFQIVDSPLMEAVKAKDSQQAVSVLRSCLPEGIAVEQIVHEAMDLTAGKD